MKPKHSLIVFTITFVFLLTSCSSVKLFTLPGEEGKVSWNEVKGKMYGLEADLEECEKDKALTDSILNNCQAAGTALQADIKRCQESEAELSAALKAKLKKEVKHKECFGIRTTEW